jgi:uncharacterized membrane protein (DUF373 family)
MPSPRSAARQESSDDPPAYVRHGQRLLTVAEDAVYVSIALLLVAGAGVLIVRAALDLVSGAGKGSADAMIDTLDSLLLVFIFVELLYAVRSTLQERQIVAEPFLIAGLLVCIKEIIVLAVTAPADYIDKGPQFARAMVEIGLLGGLVVVLAASAVLLRRKEREPEENSNAENASGT